MTFLESEERVGRRKEKMLTFANSLEQEAG